MLTLIAFIVSLYCAHALQYTPSNLKELRYHAPSGHLEVKRHSTTAAYVETKVLATQNCETSEERILSGVLEFYFTGDNCIASVRILVPKGDAQTVGSLDIFLTGNRVALSIERVSLFNINTQAIESYVELIGDKSPFSQIAGLDATNVVYEEEVLTHKNVTINISDYYVSTLFLHYNNVNAKLENTNVSTSRLNSGSSRFDEYDLVWMSDSDSSLKSVEVGGRNATASFSGLAGNCEIKTIDAEVYLEYREDSRGKPRHEITFPTITSTINVTYNSPKGSNVFYRVPWQFEVTKTIITVNSLSESSHYIDSGAGEGHILITTDQDTPPSLAGKLTNDVFKIPSPSEFRPEGYEEDTSNDDTTASGADVLSFGTASLVVCLLTPFLVN